MNGNKKAVNWLTSAHFISDVYSGFMTPLMPFIAVKLEFSLALAAMIVSISQFISSTIQPLFGYLADINRKRFFIFWGLILSSVSNPIAANVKSVWLLFLFVILGNLGGSFFHPQALGFVSRFSIKNSVYNMSLFVTAGTVGFAFGPLISSYIAQTFGYEHLLLTSVVGLTASALMFKYVPKLPVSEFEKVHTKFFEAIKNILKNKTMMILITIGLMKTLIQSSCSIMIPFLWKDLGYSPFYIGFGMFLFLFAGGVGSFLSHWFENKFGAKFVFYSSMTLTFPLMLVYAGLYRTNSAIALFIFVVIGFLTAFAQPITLVMAQKTLPEYRSIVSGIINGFTWGIVALLLIILGNAAEKIGIMPILITLSVFPAISAILIKYLPKNVEE